MVDQTIGHYIILDLLGRGGMGEVYRANDTVLDRDVAIKLLPEEFSTDPERLARFEREAKVLAALNHAHIGAIYGLEQDDGQHFLVLELVDGETLADRISRGLMQAAEAVPLAIQIAWGLEAAHEGGIVHRDLKPANIKITPEGVVKVLDFGLAKPSESDSADTLSDSPTLKFYPTGVGVRLGTAAYMSPEQVRGREVDRRADIWAFGVVLWEMLTGKKLFQGDTVSDVLAATLMREPDWEGLPPDLPPGVRRVLRHCLVQDTKERLHDIADARIELEEALEEPEDEVATPAAQIPLRRRVFLGLAAVLTLAMGWFFWPEPEPEPLATLRFEIALPEGERLAHAHRHGFDLSPDGRLLAYVSGEVTHRWGLDSRQIYLHELDSWEAEPVAGTERGAQPMFSPDGKWLAFSSFTQDDGIQLRKVSVTGGETVTICKCNASFGATWAPDNTIIFASERGGLDQVSALGGEPEVLTRIDEQVGEYSHRLPHVLPGGEAVLFSVMSAAPGQEPQVAIYSMRTGVKRKLIDDGVDALYVDSGHLVFARLGRLIAVPFDLESLEIVGPEVPVLEGVSQSTFIGNSFMETSTAQFTVSDSGLLAYARGSVAPELERDLVLVDFLGQETRVEIEKKNFLAARVAKDGNRVLLTTNYPPWAVWLFDIERGTLTRQTFSGLTHWATWGPGPDQFTFESFDSEFGGSGRIYVKEVGSGPTAAEPLSDEGFWAPSSWSPDGEHLAALKLDQNTRWDIWILDADGKAEVLLNSEFNESYPEFSPDGRWLLYVSNESGRNEVYVRPFPGPGSAIHVSVVGGSKPCWSREGDQIFFWVYSEESEADNLYAVDIREESGTLTVSRPKELFEGSYHSASPLRSADVTADDRLIVIPRPSQEAKDALTEAMMPDRIQLVQNWPTELELKVPRQR